MKDFANFSVCIWIICIALFEMLFPCCAKHSYETLQRIQKEHKDFTKHLRNGITVTIPNLNEIYIWHCTMIGPKDTPYENGVFKFQLIFTEKYPQYPPKVKFFTRIYHPNINIYGEICVDLLKKRGWKSQLSVDYVFMGLTALLEEPNPEDPINHAIANQYKYRKEDFNSVAKYWAQLFANAPNQ